MERGYIVNEWIPLSERLPPRDDRYLVYAPSADPDKPMILIAWFHPDSKKWSLILEIWSSAITHWMEVPGPPKETR